MPEISHVRIAVPEQGALNRILREGGAQLFPQWLYAEPGAEARILWWGVRGGEALPVPVDEPDDDGGSTGGLWPRPVDDWTEAPRGLVLATVDLDRAARELAAILGDVPFHDAGPDEVLGATCRRATLERSALILAEPVTEGYTAACLARFGEGPIAVALDGRTASGRTVRRCPVTGGPATYVRLGPGTAPTFIFLPPQGPG